MPRQCNGSARVRELYSAVEIVICDTTLCAEAVQLIAVRTAGCSQGFDDDAVIVACACRA